MRGRDLLSLSFRVIGLLFIAIAGGSAVSTTLFVRQAVQTTGAVVEFERRQNAIGLMPEGEETGIISYPVIEYDSEGASFRVTGRSGVSEAEFPEGTQVELLVSAENPQDARIATLMGTWGSPLILAGIGFLFLVLGALAPFGFAGGRAKE